MAIFLQASALLPLRYFSALALSRSQPTIKRSSVDVKCTLLLSSIYGEDGEDGDDSEDDKSLRRLDCLLGVVGVDGDETGDAARFLVLLQEKRKRS